MIGNILQQQDRINSLYEETKELRERNQDLEEFQRNTRLGLFLKNKAIFRVNTFLRRKSPDDFFHQWDNTITHGEIVHLFSEILPLLGIDCMRKDNDRGEPDVVGISCHSVPPYVVLGEIKTVSGNKKLGCDEVAQVISKVERYKRTYPGYRILPVIVTNASEEQISDEALRDSKNTATILTKTFIADLVRSHLNYKHTKSLLYTIFEPRDDSLRTAEDLKPLESLSNEDNKRLNNEVICDD